MELLRTTIFTILFAIVLFYGIMIDNLFIVLGSLIIPVIMISTNRTSEKRKQDLINNEINLIFDNYNFTVKDKFINLNQTSVIALNNKENELLLINRNNRNEKFKVDRIYVEDIIEVSVIEDNVTLTKSSKGGAIGGMVVGGALAGGVGAIVGGLSGNKTSTDMTTSMILSIVVNDISNPIREVRFLPYNTPLKKDTFLFEDIRSNITKWHKIIEIIINRN